MEVITSLEIAHPAEVTNQLEYAKARATRKAKARTQACGQLKSDTWGEKQWKDDRQWEPADSQWQEPQWESDSEVWETTTDGAKPGTFGTLDVNSTLGYTQRPSCDERARSGSSSTTTRYQR